MSFDIADFKRLDNAAVYTQEEFYMLVRLCMEASGITGEFHLELGDFYTRSIMSTARGSDLKEIVGWTETLFSAIEKNRELIDSFYVVCEKPKEIKRNTWIHGKIMYRDRTEIGSRGGPRRMKLTALEIASLAERFGSLRRGLMPALWVYSYLKCRTRGKHWDYRGRKIKGVWISMSEASKELKIGYRTLLLYVKALAEIGLVEITHAAEGNACLYSIKNLDSKNREED